jgi:hypothetical protein
MTTLGMVVSVPLKYSMLKKKGSLTQMLSGKVTVAQ